MASSGRSKPQYSMRATWPLKDRSEWSRGQRMISRVYPPDYERKVPVFAKTDPMAYVPHWYNHFWILSHAIWPLAVHRIAAWYLGRNIPIFLAFPLYVVGFNINAARLIRMMRDLGYRHGYMDGDRHPRDDVPDNAVYKVHYSLIATSTIRPIMTLFLAYRSSQLPTLNWYLPLTIGVYSVVLDFWFYWYHRLMHEWDGLWQYHRTHHLTKHPTPVLSLFADLEQEFCDTIVIPLLSFLAMKALGFPMTFYDWWFCQEYILFGELWGHSGLRVMSSQPTPFTPLLELLGMEMVTEDHDLHHRNGWRTSHNYGKQTRVWDRVFGTCEKRIEFVPKNVDYTRTVHLWWW